MDYKILGVLLGLFLVVGMVDAEIMCDKVCAISSAANSRTVTANLSGAYISFTPILSGLEIPQPDSTKADGGFMMGSDDYSVNVYPKPEKEGFEFDIVLMKPPKSNVFSYAVDDSNNLVYYYQPMLTEEEVKHGVIRPDDVVGSYAVYGNGGYGGKVAHIYRPQVYDSGGDKIWAGLTITDGTMLVEVDKEWLEKADYPVTIDPVLGMTTLGATSDYWNGRITGGCWTAFADGIAYNITYYVSLASPGFDFNMTGALYNKSGTTYTLMTTANDYTVFAGSGTLNTWFSWNLVSNVSLWRNGVYCIAIIDNQTGSAIYHRWLYDSGGVSFYKTNTFPTFPDPLTSVTTQTQKKSEFIAYYTVPQCGEVDDGEWLYDDGVECVVTTNYARTSGDLISSGTESSLIFDAVVLNMPSGSRAIAHNGGKIVFRNGAKMCGGTTCV